MKKYNRPIRIAVQIALVFVIASYAFPSCTHAHSTTLDSNIVGSNAEYEIFTFYNCGRDTQSYSIFFSVVSVNAGTYFVYVNNSLGKPLVGDYSIDFVHNWTPYDLIISSNSQVDGLVFFNFLFPIVNYSREIYVNEQRLEHPDVFFWGSAKINMTRSNYDALNDAVREVVEFQRSIMYNDALRLTKDVVWDRMTGCLIRSSIVEETMAGTYGGYFLVLENTTFWHYDTVPGWFDYLPFSFAMITGISAIFEPPAIYYKVKKKKS